MIAAAWPPQRVYCAKSRQNHLLTPLAEAQVVILRMPLSTNQIVKDQVAPEGTTPETRSAEQTLACCGDEEANRFAPSTATLEPCRSGQGTQPIRTRIRPGSRDGVPHPKFFWLCLRGCFAPRATASSKTTRPFLHSRGSAIPPCRSPSLLLAAGHPGESRMLTPRSGDVNRSARTISKKLRDWRLGPGNSRVNRRKSLARRGPG